MRGNGGVIVSVVSVCFGNGVLRGGIGGLGGKGLECLGIWFGNMNRLD